MTSQKPSERTVVVRLNQQQLELLDRTVADLGLSGRDEALRRGLMGFHTLVIAEEYDA